LVLELTNVTAGYGPVTVLRSVDFAAAAGQVTCVMGRNGAGKTTLLKTIMGLLRPTEGTIHIGGVAIHDLPAHEVPRHGLAWVPQGRRLFGPLAVAENLEVGGLARGNRAEVRDHVLRLFPRLRERLDQPASTLSGGEQQMLAIARALCLEPKVLLLDEPTEGLQPSMIALIRDAVLQLKAEGVAVVLVEQRVDAVLKMADRVAFMAHGRVEEMIEASALEPGARAFLDYVGV
jgi:branched-chain amino acid transport system ATP-binding protein